MQLKHDNANHWFAETQNLRVTFVPVTDRAPNTRWTDTDVIRIQSYRGEKNHALHQDAEIPVRSSEDIGALFAAICEVYTTARF